MSAQIVKAGTKLEVIAKALDTFCGLVLIEEGTEYFIVKKGRETCRHRDTDHGKHCHDPANVPCGKWEYDESLTAPVEAAPVTCEGCTTVYRSILKECPKCGAVPSESITDLLVRCDRAGEHTACVQCNHGSNHVGLNGCDTGAYDYCCHVNCAVKCVPIKKGDN